MTSPSHFSAWLEALRLRTLPVSVAGVITGIAYAIAAGGFSLIPAILCLIFALLAQIASNFANEYYDFRNGLDRPGRTGPRRGVTEGDITPAAMLSATYGTIALAAAVGLCLLFYGPWWLILVGLVVAVGLLAYSTGPFPLSHHGLGEVAVIFFFGLVPVNLTAWLCGCPWSWNVAAGSLAIGFMGANVLIVNNFRDTEEDRAVNKHTLSVIMGARHMPRLYALNALAAAALTAFSFLNVFSSAAVLLLPAAYLLAALTIARVMSQRSGAELTPLLGCTAMLMSVFALCFFIMAAL
ncbi:MAG: 1,4-dihydroxy-2-naphthoate octaprenyltransferase [Muribaculaceae bacterium]|nr:1,4-dihydroxy-2-naphthoate octaprenyltransferase [Muribaculaceae bacterium]